MKSTYRNEKPPQEEEKYKGDKLINEELIKIEQSYEDEGQSNVVGGKNDKDETQINVKLAKVNTKQIGKKGEQSDEDREQSESEPDEDRDKGERVEDRGENDIDGEQCIEYREQSDVNEESYEVNDQQGQKCEKQYNEMDKM